MTPPSVPWLHLAAAIGIYLAAALLASVLVRRVGSDLRSFEGRTSPSVLGVGAGANLLVLGLTLLLLVRWDGRPISDLGVGFTGRDVGFTAAALAATAAASGGFLAWLAHTGRSEVGVKSLSGGGRLLGASAVLVAVALQEEVLFRGYLTVHLLPLGAPAVLLLTTAAFTAIHFPTNWATPAQVTSWTLGGLMLGFVYLASHSIWVPVILHLATDLTNVLALGIAGEVGWVRLSRPLTARQRAGFRAVQVALILGLTVLAYSPLRWLRT